MPKCSHFLTGLYYPSVLAQAQTLQRTAAKCTRQKQNMSPVRIELTIFGFLTSCAAGVDQYVRYETDALAN